MLKAENIHKVYKDGKKELHVLKGIDLEIDRAEVIAIVGPSGAGKSTLLHILGGLDRPNSGRVLLNGDELYSFDDKDRARIRNERIGFVFQFYHLLPEFTALENVLLPGIMSNHGGSKGEIAKKAEEILIDMGLGERLTHKPSELSGGEQQRVAIARALMNEPEILLCDEPTGNLDSKMGEEILNLLFDLNKKKSTTIVVVTHEKEIAGRANRIVQMRDGRLI